MIFSKKDAKRGFKASSEMLLNNMPKDIAAYVSEAYKSVRANLLFSFAKSSNHVAIITSAEPDAGKSTTTANLALTIAQSGSSVLIIDADMRKPRQNKVFGVSNTNGLSKLLSGQTALDNTSLLRGVAKNVDLIPAGPTPPNPVELLNSPAMGQLLKELSQVYDFILIDTAPTGVLSDALALLTYVQNVIVVARQGKTTYPEIRRCLSSITSLGGVILGTIITDTTSGSRTNYRYHYYSHYGYYLKTGYYPEK